MGFKLKNVVKAASSVIPAVAATKFIGDMTRAQSPTLPNTPDPILYPEVSNFTPEELDLLLQRRQLLTDYQSRLNAQPTAYDQSNEEIAAAENARYLQALKQQQGQLSVAQQQARNAEYQKLVESAGRRGIRILGDDPTTATSDSTAGNQILSEFNKRYALLADQQRQADLSFGGTQNLNRMGLVNNVRQNYFTNSLGLNNAYGGLQDVYGGMRQARDNRNFANIDIRNQALLNNYDRNANQEIYNTNARNQTRANRLGLINSGVQAGAMFLAR